MDNEALYQKTICAIADNAKDMAPGDYFEYLEKVASHIEALIECYKEEHPEDFE